MFLIKLITAIYIVLMHDSKNRLYYHGDKLISMRNTSWRGNLK